ncbi:hypothetical protein IAT40_006610 [Kwoniella sp. CBS 6097]
MIFQLSLLFWLATTTLAWNDTPKSVIVLIPDGFGPSQATLTRETLRVQINSSELHGKLAFDDHAVGTLQTKSANQLVTDSAAAGTAYACGINTNNGIIGSYKEGRACATVLEGAKALGYKTGLVTTTRITHATPAAFGSHVLDRDNEATIAQQYLGEYALGRQVDLLWGGGRGFFLPQSDSGSSRKDDRNLIEEAKQNGYYYISNSAELDEYKSKAKSHLARRTDAHLPSLGLFTKSHMSYEIDRDASKEPSLSDMAIGALDALDNGPFFIMIEGGRIDHAAHANDPATIYHDVLAYEETYQKVIEWVDSHEHPEQFQVLAMADHDTGGASLPGGWLPEVLLNATHSAEYLSDWTEAQVANITDAEALEIISQQVLVEGMGIPANQTVAEELLAALRDEESIAGDLADLKNRAAGLNWGTGGHSEVDVNLVAYPFKQELIGNHPNIAVSQYIAELLGMDLASIESQLASVDLGPAVQGAAT